MITLLVPWKRVPIKKMFSQQGFLSMETGLLIPKSGAFGVRMCFNEGDHNESECIPNSECLSHLSFSVHILA